MQVFNSRSKNRLLEHKNDRFVTPAWCVDVLCKHLEKNNLDKNISCAIDFSCGETSLATKLKMYFNNKDIFEINSDIEDFVDEETCFKSRVVKYNLNKGLKILIMNPPYNQKDVFIEKTIAFVDFAEDSIGALLLPTTSLNGVKRSKIYNQYDVRLNIIALSKRPLFMGKSSNLDVSWFIWSKKFKEDSVCWI